MSGKDYVDDKRKYIFFEDPDVVQQRAEDTAAAHHLLAKPTSDLQLAAYPFTFISAVKRKLILSAQNDRRISPDLTPDAHPMDFVKPLKVPDLKILPKALSTSPRKFSLPKDSPKLEKSEKTPKSEKVEKTSKLSLVHRKLDFSGSEGTSLISNDDVDPLKPPDISLPNSSKKKEYLTASSREKENRSKKPRKEESSFSPSADSPDMGKRRNLRHVSRKDLEGVPQKITAERFLPREDLDVLARKSQRKGLSSKKDSRSTSSYSSKSRERSLESRNRTFSSESLLERSLKPREPSRGSGSESSLHKYESSQHRGPKNVHKILDKSKRSKAPTSHHRVISTQSELSEDLETESPSKLKRKVKEVEQKNERISTEFAGDFFLDPRRISFRDDSYSQQEEFENLVTPEFNLKDRLKSRRDLKSSKNQELDVPEIPKRAPEDLENGPLVHPTALHMQFQAELHLFDSCNESLRQVMDVENSLYNVKQDKERDLVRRALGSNEVTPGELNREVELPREDPVDRADRERITKEADSMLATAANALCNAKEVHTQTVNDIATQTDSLALERSKFPGITYSRGSLCDLGHLSLNSINELSDLSRIEEISLPSKIRTMSEISLHETTSSIKTETGTEISISTRDVTCSFNKYLDHEMAQLIKDEKLMYDKIEMLFKSREKTLNDRTRKLVKLEEQKRALRDAGQDSRISSVKKKQRALLLKLQQEKDEMNRLKELHKLASQERKLMLQKQRNMFNPQMSTKNILTKLKRSADCQSPRRLSGPMKGYDIRSNSSVSSLVDSDKSQVERSRQGLEKGESKPSKLLQDSSNSSQVESPKKYELKPRKFEETMPKGDLLRLKAHHLEIDSKFLKGNIADSLVEDDKTESDTLVEDSKKISGDADKNLSRRKGMDDKGQRKLEKTPVSDSKSSSTKKKSSKASKGKGGHSVESFRGKGEGDELKKRPRDSSTEGNSISGTLDLNDSQNSLHALLKHSKAVKEKNHKLLRDIADENEAQVMAREEVEGEGPKEEVQGLGNISTRSHVSTFTISRHSSGDSEKSYSRSVVIRSQDSRFKAPKKLAQILNAREAALATRRNCVEDWIAWHARLKAEESRVARMEEAAYKLVSATTNALCNDTTISSDTSDVEGRVELLAEKLTERRAEMAKLRREARRQAKQRLKALEANLLNQIQKYDTTIHEMRKKLDSKRALPKDSGKLAIEARQIADFKVPDLPIKRIQEIYRNSDLLHSRSESDLLTGRSSPSPETRPLSRSIESILEDGKIRRSTPPSSRITENLSKSQEISDKSSINSEISTEPNLNNSPHSESSIFSRKMDSLHLNNRNITDDISTLENDLKTLSEMMSKFSKKSEKVSSVQTPSSDTIKNTSRDISEDLTRSEIPEIEVSNFSPKTFESSPINSEKSPKSSKSNGPSLDKSVKTDQSIPPNSPTIVTAGNNLEINSAALERSISTLHRENEALSSDFTSLAGDIKSISEIISKMTETQRSIPESVESSPSDNSANVSSISYHSIAPENPEASIFESEKTQGPETSRTSLKSESCEVDGNAEGNESSLISENSENHLAPSERDDLSLERSDWTISDSFEVPKVSLIETDPAASFRDTGNAGNGTILDGESPDSVFMPRGESTTIDGKILRNDNFDLDDELGDIMEVIQRDQEHVPDADDLGGEVGDKGPDALNLTADVEPVLQKLTEILISVEKNIARRTEGKSPESSKSDPWSNQSPSQSEKTTPREIDFKDDNLVETDIDQKLEMNEHLDEALAELTLEEVQATPEHSTSKGSPPKDVEAPPTAETPTSPEKPEGIKNPEYEDISEESLEISQIFDRSESQNSQKSQKFSKVPDKYQGIEKPENVLRILDEISWKSRNKDLDHLKNVEINVEVFGDISPCVPGLLEDLEPKDYDAVEPLVEEPESRKTVSDDSSDAGDTPREVSEIDLDSPREQNDSRLDIEALDDDLLTVDKESEFPGDGATEKDIEMMIDKLRATLDQPGVPVKELDARLLRIEQLQIELEIERIKKLEAEEVSLFVREIPNKPPPPYTPPGVVRLTSPQVSPTLPPAVIPTNVDELTAFTEKATALIYNSKFNEEEIMALEAPLEILESKKDSNDGEKKDRKIYNTFLFDLCKETIAEIYQSEYEKPGPSWTKPSVKTKPAVKIPKNLEELTDYVNKEVATLFGFKTKLQRENMVMRWSRKRRDRVDELLAREAQAEEDEWTKFHHDELAVKNELTIAILDTLVLETTSVVKAAFTKKQKIFV